MCGINVTIIVPLGRDVPVLFGLLRSIVASARHSGITAPELFVVFHCTRTLLPQELDSMKALYGSANGTLRVIPCDDNHQTAKRNIGVQSSHSDWIAFLDDDVEVEADYLSRLACACSESNRVVQGVPYLAANPHMPLAKFEEELYRNGILNYTTTSISGWLDAKNLVMRRNLALAFPFSTHFRFGSEGQDLAIRIRQEKILIAWDPTLRVRHWNRDRVVALAAQKWIHGRGRGDILLTHFSVPSGLGYCLGCWVRHFVLPITAAARGHLRPAVMAYCLSTYFVFWSGCLYHLVTFLAFQAKWKPHTT